MKRVFGYAEAVFDALYLFTAAALGIALLLNPASPAQRLAGTMALVLAGGDAFHLLPRMAAVLTGDEARFRGAMGLGKLVTSLTMTAYYLLMWRLGGLLFSPGGAGWTTVFWILAGLRAALCLFPQNRWRDRYPPVRWGVYRNLPFLLMGAMAAALFGWNAARLPALRWMWLAIVLSFAFYLPVVLWSNRRPGLGMLMLPKTCAYLWMLVMFLSL